MEDIDRLFEQYKRGRRATMYSAKIALLNNLYGRWRPIRGEGNCFYRSFWMGWIDHIRTTKRPACVLLQNPRSEAWRSEIQEITNRLSPHLPPNLEAEFRGLCAPFIEMTALLVDQPGEDALLRESRNTARTAQVIRWLRLLTSAYIRSDSGMNAFFLDSDTGLLTDPMVFVEHHVEPDGIDADEPQIMALVKALRVSVRLEVLDERSPEWSIRYGIHKHTYLEGYDGSPLIACVLLRTGHYDMLQPRDWSDRRLVQPSDDVLVQPTPPRPGMCWLCASERGVRGIPILGEGASICQTCFDRKLRMYDHKVRPYPFYVSNMYKSPDGRIGFAMDFR